jgi:hypothetical protein
MSEWSRICAVASTPRTYVRARGNYSPRPNDDEVGDGCVSQRKEAGTAVAAVGLPKFYAPVTSGYVLTGPGFRAPTSSGSPDGDIRTEDNVPANQGFFFVVP